MRNSNLKHKTMAVGLMVLALMGLGAVPAFATDPTPPDVSTTLSTIIAAFANAGVTVVTSLAANTWILFVFAFGIGVAILRSVLRRFRHHGASAVKH